MPFVGAVLGTIVFGGLSFIVCEQAHKNAEPQFLPNSSISSEILSLKRNNGIPSYASPFGDMRAIKELPKPQIKPPSIPSMPVGNATVSVVGLLPPDMAMVMRNGHVGTVKANTDTVEFGSIGNITSEGVYIDGVLHKYEIFNRNIQK